MRVIDLSMTCRRAMSVMMTVWSVVGVFSTAVLYTLIKHASVNFIYHNACRKTLSEHSGQLTILYTQFIISALPME